ncbi:MAG: Fe-S cluster assembly protein SufD [Candidatus Contendobacter sp.]
MIAAAPELQDTYRPVFAEFTTGRREPDAIARLRREAFARFETLGLPTRQQEAWRLTELSGLRQWNPQRPTLVPVDAGALPTLGLPAHRLVFVNGHYAPGLSQLREMPDQALIANLGQALLTHPELIAPHLDCLPGLAWHPFAALNTAFWEDGAFVHLPRGTVVETPIHLIFHATGGDMTVYPRLLLVLEENTQATVIVEHQGAGRYLNGPVTEARLGDGAVLHYHKIQQESPQAFHLGAIRIQQGRNSEANVHLLSFGGLVARTDFEALLDGEGACCKLNGLTLARDQQFSDVHVRVEHAQPHGSSQQLFKSVLDDKARTVFDGMIHVRPHAQKTDARQVSRNLLLSRQAQANSNPRLEILADDVKCGHGSTTGFLNPDAEFYLRARGIGAEQARAMLVHAFANDSLNQIRLTPLRERFARLLAAGLALDLVESEVA